LKFLRKFAALCAATLEWGAQPPRLSCSTPSSNTFPGVSSEGAGNRTRGACAPPNRPSQTGFRKRVPVRLHLISARQVHPLPDWLWPRSKAPEGWRTPRRFAFAKPLRISARFWTAAALRRFSPAPLHNPCSSVSTRCARARRGRSVVKIQTRLA